MRRPVQPTRATTGRGPARTRPSRRRRALRALLLAALPAVLLLPSAPASAEPFDADAVTAELFALLQEAREEAGVGVFDRRELLDGVAAERAALVASLPHAKRLRVDEPISDKIREAGLLVYRNVTTHLDMQRGYRIPAGAFFVNWKKYSAWKSAMDPRYDAIGLGTAKADDDWIVLVAVLLDELILPTDMTPIEEETLDAVNAERERRGLGALVHLEELSAVARRHSEDMARRQYFAHESPDGDKVSDRVRAAGMVYRAVAENIYQGHAFENPSSAATRAWMKSKGHRKNILDSRMVVTGVGVAIDREGKIFFTQVFGNP